MESIESKLTALNTLVLEGKAIEAFSQYYHPDVKMQENDDPPTIGKDVNLEREKQFFNSISEFRYASVKGMSVNGNLSFVIWEYDYTHKDWGIRKYTQVSVQHWKEGLIVHEQFFYGN